jgi:alpha-ketoglutaric semialdehyde dehydrogenase
MPLHPVLIDGAWRAANVTGSFQAVNPATGEALPDEYPRSAWADCDAALDAAQQAFAAMRGLDGEQIAKFLESYAAKIETNAAQITAAANLETAYPVKPRLADVELPRTVNQIRQSAAAAREGSWAMPTIDAPAGVRSMFGPIGPVFVLGPNNFPLAYGSISGGDFAAAVAAGNPVIAKAHPGHPTTARHFAEQAQAAAKATGMPAGIVQMLYDIAPEDGLRIVADPRIGATAFTGSRTGGLRLKHAADQAGKPIYLEMSSINPVVILPGALEERFDQVVGDFFSSCLMAAGQFCTNPGLVLLVANETMEKFAATLGEKFQQAPVGTLLSKGVQQSLTENVAKLVSAGAKVLAGARGADGQGFHYANTLLRVSGEQFLRNPHGFQTEAFGNASLLVVADDADEIAEILSTLEGNLTGSIYSHTQGQDDDAYRELAPLMRHRVGRLLNDKMPTGVAVSPAMQHGGPYPATGHPAFTAVGVPATMLRFGMLQSYDNVREARLPPALRDKNPTGKMWRRIAGAWTQADVQAT